MHLLDFQPLRFDWFQRKSLVVLGIDLWPAIGYVGWCKEVSDNDIVVKEKISLTELIDLQSQKVRKTICDKYGEECETKNLPILSAISASLDVDGAREWLPFYKKKWKIDPDSIEFSVLEWTMLVYQECIVSSYYDLRE